MLYGELLKMKEEPSASDDPRGFWNELSTTSDDDLFLSAFQEKTARARS